MSKEVIRPEQFAQADKTALIQDTVLELNDEQRKELLELYEGAVAQFKQGKLVVGKVLKADSDGVLVDISYKSDGLITHYEFSEH